MYFSNRNYMCYLHKLYITHRRSVLTYFLIYLKRDVSTLWFLLCFSAFFPYSMMYVFFEDITVLKTEIWWALYFIRYDIFFISWNFRILHIQDYHIVLCKVILILPGSVYWNFSWWHDRRYKSHPSNLMFDFLCPWKSILVFQWGHGKKNSVVGQLRVVDRAYSMSALRSRSDLSCRNELFICFFSIFVYTGLSCTSYVIETWYRSTSDT